MVFEFWAVYKYSHLFEWDVNMKKNCFFGDSDNDYFTDIYVGF